MALTKVDVNMVEASGLVDANYLKGDGTWGAIASAGFSKYTVVIASDSTFDLDSDTTKLIIEIQASGSTAGSTDGATYGGGGGGAGAYAKKLLTGYHLLRSLVLVARVELVLPEVPMVLVGLGALFQQLEI